MTEGPTGRPGGPGRPNRFYFDDLADEPVGAAADQTETDVEEDFDDLVDTGPIQVILDPLPGSAAQQLHLDDLDHSDDIVDEPEAGQPEPAEADELAAASQLYFDDLDGVPESEPAGHVPPPWETDDRPAALALNGGRRRPRPIAAVIALLAVLGLVAVIAAISSGGNGGHSRDAAHLSKPKASGPPTGGPATHATQSPSAPHSSAPAHSSAPTHRTAAPTTAPAGIPLTVLNNTTESGLAKTAAQAFSTKGWQVGTVGNYTGQISVTTVYYNPSDPDQRQAAETLAKQYPGVAQVQPRFADLPGTGLTVVLAPGWHL